MKCTLCTRAPGEDLRPLSPAHQTLSPSDRPSFCSLKITHSFLSLHPCTCCSSLECWSQLTVTQISTQKSPPQRGSLDYSNQSRCRGSLCLIPLCLLLQYLPVTGIILFLCLLPANHHPLESMPLRGRISILFFHHNLHSP